MSFYAPSPPGRRPPLRHHHGRFRGVRIRSWGRWVAEIRIPHSRDKIWLGSYSLPELAARVYDTAYLLLRGPSASSSLNLSDSSRLITPHLAAYTKGRHAITARTIQTAAAQIAHTIARAETSLICLTDEEEIDAKSGEESGSNGLRENSMGEGSLQGLNSMKSPWIHDLLGLLSPRENVSKSSFLPTPAAASNTWVELAGSLSCSANQQKLMSATSLAVCDEFHQALQEALAQDGFIPMSCAVTTRESFDTDVAAPSDALWTYPETYY